MSPIKVLIEDDHFLIRDGRVIELDQTYGITVVETLLNEMNLFEKLMLHLPDLLVMDMQQPIEEIMIRLMQIKGLYPELKVLMLIASVEDDEMLEALIYGASGYLLRNISEAKLINCIREAISGELVLPTTITIKLAARHWMYGNIGNIIKC